MPPLPSHSDFVVIGAGIAGLRAAIELASAGTVLVLSKPLTGGRHISAAPLSDEDEISVHLQATVQAGDGLCNRQAAEILVNDAPERIDELIRWASEFEHDHTHLTVGAVPHGRDRIFHAQGHSTAAEVTRALHAKVKSLRPIFIRETFAADLISDGERVSGVVAIDENGGHWELHASAVLVATGGLGQVYRHTTNSSAATGDGVAMVLRAGAEVSDMEFVQFHPTALYAKNVPRLLLSDALLSEGAYLRNLEMHRFMMKYHPAGESAPREVITRAIMHELEVSRAKEAIVYLDLTHIGAHRVKARFPRLFATFQEYDLDISTDLIPVRPAAHFAAGGARCDLDGRSSLAGLYAAGEAAATGVHGANRLPSNALLEALVFGARAGAAMRSELRHVAQKSEMRQKAASNGPVNATAEQAIQEVQDVMWHDAGIVRTRHGLKTAIERLNEICPRVAHPQTWRGWEAQNLHSAGLLIARSALAREESRGAHYRSDYPAHNDSKFLKRSIVKGEQIRFA